jgi:hypothetical protein
LKADSGKVADLRFHTLACGDVIFKDHAEEGEVT